MIKLTEGPGSPGGPIGPDAPGGPCSPGVPGTPSSPSSPSSPWRRIVVVEHLSLSLSLSSSLPLSLSLSPALPLSLFSSLPPSPSLPLSSYAHTYTHHTSNHPPPTNLQVVRVVLAAQKVLEHRFVPVQNSSNWPTRTCTSLFLCPNMHLRVVQALQANQQHLGLRVIPEN